VREILKRPKVLVGAAILLVMVVISVLAPLLAPYDPTASSVMFLSAPSPQNWLGTDELGRDILSRMIYGGQSSLIVGIGAAVIAAVIGIPVGLCAGYMGGRVDLVATQVIDIFIALPGLILALIITAMVGPTLLNLVLVLGFVSWPRIARLIRGQTLALRESVFVEASKAVGARADWIMLKHIWPNTMRIVAAQFALTVAYSIFTSASLSFLGLGVPPPTPDWGAMVRAGFDYLALNPGMSLAPGAAVAATVFGFYLIGTSIK
jgi:peptide/nickel transport system permease protein